MSHKIKVQHYIPRFYLQSFSIKVKEDYLYCFDKSKSKKFVVNSRNIGCESYFYDTSEDVAQLNEKALSHFESLFKSVHKKLVTSKDLSVLTSKERLLMAYFVTTQEVRTKERRAMFEDMIRQVTKKLSERKLPKESVEQIKLDEERIKLLHISTLEDVPDFAEIICKMKWMLHINRTSKPFWCSDHPVSRYNPINQWPGGEMGLLCEGIKIYFPLSPRISLCMGHPTTYASLPSRDESTDVQEIEFQNALQVFYSTSYIFSNKDDFSLAEKMIRDNPPLADTERKRFIVH